MSHTYNFFLKYYLSFEKYFLHFLHSIFYELQANGMKYISCYVDNKCILH